TTPGEAVSSPRGESTSFLNTAPLPPEYTPRRMAVGQSFAPAADNAGPEDWRNEVANCLQAHRAKRRKRNGEDATMSFGFDEPQQLAVEEPPVVPNHWESWDPVREVEAP